MIRVSGIRPNDRDELRVNSLVKVIAGASETECGIILAYLTLIEVMGPHTQRHLEAAFTDEEKMKDMRETFAKEYYPFFRFLADQQAQEGRAAAGV